MCWERTFHVETKRQRRETGIRSSLSWQLLNLNNKQKLRGKAGEVFFMAAAKIQAALALFLSRAHLFFRTSFWEVEFSYFVTRLLNFMMMLFGGIFLCEWFIKWAAARIFTFLFLHYNDTMINHNHVISCSRFLFIPRRRRRRVLNCRAAMKRFFSFSLCEYFI